MAKVRCDPVAREMREGKVEVSGARFYPHVLAHVGECREEGGVDDNQQ
jgi:hypothetical protein